MRVYTRVFALVKRVCVCVCVCVLQRSVCRVYGRVAPVSFMYDVPFQAYGKVLRLDRVGGSDRGVSRIEIANLAYSQSSCNFLPI